MSLFPSLSKDKKMFRGCLSDASDVRLKCEKSDERNLGTCVKCSGSGCNNQPKVAKSKLSCFKCIDSKECAFGQNGTDPVSCVDKVPFGIQESCYTHAIKGNF